MRKSLLAVTAARLRRRRNDGVRDQGLRQEPGRPGQQQGRHAQHVARGNAGAHAARTKRGSARSTPRPAPRRRSATAGAARRPPRPTARPWRPAKARARRTTPPRRRRRAVEALDKSSKRIVYEVVLSEDSGNFKFGTTALPDEAKAQIDELVAQAEGRSEGRVLRNRRPHRQRRRQDGEREARHGARRSREAVPLRAAPDSAAPDERDQLRRRRSR